MMGKGPFGRREQSRLASLACDSPCVRTYFLGRPFGRREQSRLASLACDSPCVPNLFSGQAVRTPGTVPSRFARLRQSLCAKLIFWAGRSDAGNSPVSLRSLATVPVCQTYFLGRPFGRREQSRLASLACDSPCVPNLFSGQAVRTPGTVPSRFARLRQSLCPNLFS